MCRHYKEETIRGFFCPNDELAAAVGKNRTMEMEIRRYSWHMVDVRDAASRIDVERKQFKINQSGGNGRARAIMSCCRVYVERTEIYFLQLEAQQ